MESEIISIKEDIATLKADIRYIKQYITEIKSAPCSKIDTIHMHRRLFYAVFAAISGIISYLTGLKLMG